MIKKYGNNNAHHILKVRTANKYHKQTHWWIATTNDLAEMVPMRYQ